MRTLFARLQRRQSEAGGEEDGVIDQAAALVLPVLNVQRNAALADKLNAMEDVFRGGKCTDAYSVPRWEGGAHLLVYIRTLSKFELLLSDLNTSSCLHKLLN